LFIRYACISSGHTFIAAIGVGDFDCVLLEAAATRRALLLAAFGPMECRRKCTEAQIVAHGELTGDAWAVRRPNRAEVSTTALASC